MALHAGQEATASLTQLAKRGAGQEAAVAGGGRAAARASNERLPCALRRAVVIVVVTAGAAIERTPTPTVAVVAYAAIGTPARAAQARRVR